MCCLIHPGVSLACYATQHMSLCSIVTSRRILLINIPKHFDYPPVSGDSVICYSFFPYELSSALGFNKLCHQSEDVVTQQNMVHIWFCLLQGLVTEAPNCIPQSFSSTCCNLIFAHLMKIHFTQHFPREIFQHQGKIPYNCKIHFQIS